MKFKENKKAIASCQTKQIDPSQERKVGTVVLTGGKNNIKHRLSQSLIHIKFNQSS